MATPSSSQAQHAAGQNHGSTSNPQGSQRPAEALTNTTSTNDTQNSAQGEQTAAGKKRRNHRGGRKKKGRRQSFALGNEEQSMQNPDRTTQDPNAASTSGTLRPPFYRLGQSGRNLSSASLDSQALLDHRCVSHHYLISDSVRTVANTSLIEINQ